MCGIFGGIAMRPDDWFADSARRDAALDAITHRGPDERGLYATADGRGFLGHRRLSIIDLAGGQQPIANEDETIHVCHNGEIYNRTALQRMLTARGHRFRTESDGEPPMHLYEDDADGFPARLQGMFAVAILDEPRRRLTLVRDRLGIKPLYYYADDRHLVFASELKAILALLPRTPSLSAAALRQYLRWKYVPAPLTIFENIYKLPPAHVAVVDYGDDSAALRPAVRRYWDLDNVGEPITDEQDAVEMLDALLRESVRSHLDSDVEVGALLSGGVDSSLVVALAAKMGAGRIKTFSVGFDEQGFDQLPYARKLAERYGTEHFEERVCLDPMETIAKLARQFDEPFADSSALACLRVSEVAARHVKVALTGDGGDETFGGYGRYEKVLSGSSPPGSLAKWRNRAIVASSGAMLSPEAKYLKRFREASLPPLRLHEVHQRLCSDWLMSRILTPPYRDDAGDADYFDEHRRRAAGRGWPDVSIAQYVDLCLYLPDDILAKVDRTSMAWGLECRVPLLDHSVTEFAMRLDPRLMFRGGVRKYLLKKVAERYVPHELIHRPKMGFRIPVRRWLKRGLLDDTATLLRDGVMVSRGILDRRGLDWMFRHQRRPWIDLASPLWALLFLEVWAEQYLADAPTPVTRGTPSRVVAPTFSD